MTDSIHAYVLGQLQASKGHWPEVARATGISRRTIEKIAREEVINPGVLFIEKLANYFRNSSASGEPTRRRGASARVST